MKKILFLSCIIVFLSCEEDEPKSIFNGKWELIEASTYYTEENGGLTYIADMDYYGDTLTYYYFRWQYLYDTVTYTSEYLYDVTMEIGERNFVTCSTKNYNSLLYKTETFEFFIENEDGYDDYDYSFNFGNIGYHIPGYLWLDIDEMNDDIMVLESYLSSTRPSGHTYRSARFTFQRVID